MKKLLALFLVLFAALLSFNSRADATVGGPSYIYNLRANQSGNMIYIQESYSGKGCPPIIYGFSLAKPSPTPLISCDEAFNTRNTYDSKFANILTQFPTPLKRIHLKHNSITANVKVIKEFKDPMEFLDYTEFNLELYQRGNKIYSTNFKGCKPDQVNLIEGYVTPNTNNLIIVLSAKDDCFEGGYTGEMLFVGPKITVTYDYAQVLRDTNTPVTIDASGDNGNLLVIAGQSNTPKVEPTPINTLEPTPTNIVTNTVDNVGDDDEITRPIVYQVTIVILVIALLLMTFKTRKSRTL